MYDYFVEITEGSTSAADSNTNADVELFDALTEQLIVEVITSGPTGLHGIDGINGINGTNGINGATWFSGAGVPDPTLGSLNDLYLNTGPGDIYKKLSTGWTVQANIKPILGSGGNFVPNPNFLDSTNGYTLSSGVTLSLDSTNGILGNAAAISRTSSTGSMTLSTAMFTVRPNVLYSAVVWFRLGTFGRTSAGLGTASVSYYDAASTLISTVVGDSVIESTQGTWALAKVLSTTSPVNADKAVVSFTVNSATTGEQHFVSGFSMQTGEAPLTGATNFPPSTFSGSMLAPASITSRETAAGSAKPLFGAATSRPTATGSGRIFMATDTGFIYLDTGSWVQIGSSGGASSMPAEPTPLDFGLLSWTYDPMLMGSNVAQAMTAGVIGIRRMIIRADTTVSNIWAGCVAAGTGLSNTYFGLYNPSGVQLAVSAECSSLFTTTGLKTMPLVTPYVATAGTYYVAWVNGAATTTAKLACGPSGGLTAAFTAITNMNTTAMYRSATYSTGFSALPATLTTATATADSRAWWFALS